MYASVGPEEQKTVTLIGIPNEVYSYSFENSYALIIVLDVI